MAANPSETGGRAAAFLRDQFPQHASKRLQSLIGCSERTAERILAGDVSRDSMERLMSALGWRFAHAVLQPLCGPAPIDHTRRFWITEAGAQMASSGYAAFVRVALGLKDDGTDFETYGLSCCGWLQASANESALVLRLEERGADPACVRHAQAWLLTQPAAVIDVELRRNGAWVRQRFETKHKAVQALDHYAAFREARDAMLDRHWMVERRPLQAVTSLSQVRLLRALAERGRQAGSIVTAVCELGLLPTSSIFVQRGSEISTVHNGTSLGISPTEFVGKNVLDRRDQKYAQLVHAHVGAAAASPEPTFHELDVTINDERWPYQRVAVAEEINPATGVRFIVTTTHLLRAKEAA